MYAMELIGEAPEEFASQAADRLSYLMTQAGLPEVTVRMKCDADVFPCWYYDVVTGEVKKQFDKMISSGISSDDAKKQLYLDFEELLTEQIDEMIES